LVKYWDFPWEVERYATWLVNPHKTGSSPQVAETGPCGTGKARITSHPVMGEGGPLINDVTNAEICSLFEAVHAFKMAVKFYFGQVHEIDVFRTR